MADSLTFANIFTEVKRASGKSKGSIDNQIKMIINQVYLNEIINADSLNPFHWLVKYNDSLISVAQSTITGITQADPGVITTSAAHGHTAGNIIMLFNIVGMTELNCRMFRVGTVGTTTVANDNFELLDLEGNNVDTSGYTAYSSAGVVNHHGFTLSGRMDEIIAAKWVDNIELKTIEVDEIESSTGFMDNDTTVSHPERYRINKTFQEDGTEINQLIWYPGSQGGDKFRYWYEYQVPKLIEDADVPMIPYKFHYTLIAGALARLVKFNPQMENAPIWPRVFASELKALVSYNRAYYKKAENNHYDKPFMM